MRKRFPFITLVLLCVLLVPGLALAQPSDGASDDANAPSGSSVAITTLQAKANVGPVDACGPEGTLTRKIPAVLLQEGCFPQGSFTSELGLGAQSITASKARRISMVKSLLTTAYKNIDTNYIDLSAYDITISDIGGIVSDVINSDPDFWYVESGSSSYWSDGRLAGVTPHYAADKSTVQRMKANYDAAINSVIAWVPEQPYNSNDDYNWYRAKAVHDWFVLNCAYNMDIYNSNFTYTVETDPWSAYGALVYHRPVCNGYALAYQAVLKRMGIPVNKATSNNHAWNRAMLDGRNWYHIDVTWDDPVPDSPGVIHDTWFAISDYRVRSLDQSSHSYWSPSSPAALITDYDDWPDGSWPKYYGGAARSSVNKVTLNTTSLTMRTFMRKQLTITQVDPYYYEKGGVTWGTSNSQVATVSKTGLVTSTGRPGFALVWCNVYGKYAFCSVNVKASLNEFATVSGVRTKTYYKGQARYQTGITVKMHDGTVLVKDQDYTIRHSNNKTAGTAYLSVTGKGNYAGKITKSFTIEKANNPMIVHVAKPAPVIKASSIRYRAGIVKAVSGWKAMGKVRYEKVSGSPKLYIFPESGKVQVKKGTKPGFYSMDVKVSASGNANYKATSKTVKVTVHVK